MSKGLKILAIGMLIVTILGAGAVLYGIKTLAPQAVEVTTTVTPAAQAQQTFDAILKSLADGLFDGRVYGDTDALEAEKSTFVTYTVRLRNSGFFPAEWISLDAAPLKTDAGEDVLQLANGGANVLAAGAQGDLSVTILTTLEQARQARTLEVECYVFGRKQTVQVRVD